jgi:hypothetical protein
VANVRRSIVAPRIDTRVVIRREPPDILEVVFRDYVDSREVEFAIEQVERELGARPARFVLINTLETTGYNANVRAPGAKLLSVLKQRGVLCGVAIAPSAAVRMIGAAVAFVAGLQIDFVPTRKDAISKLAHRRVS